MSSEQSLDFLPAGWTTRSKSNDYGKKVKFYVDPATGRKFYSKAQVVQYLEKVKSETVPESVPESGPESVLAVAICSPDNAINKANKSSDWLPDGWLVEERTRNSGNSAGSKFKVYTDPKSGLKFYSKPEVSQHLAKISSSSSIPPLDINVVNKVSSMTNSIADELYSEILEQSNGEMSSKSTSLANHFNSSDSHEDELWIEDGLSWNGSNNESEKESDLDREWQRRRDQFHTIGYRDGLIAGKEASAQEGFNTGFSESVFVGYKWGLVRGVSSALACLPDGVRKRLIESEEKQNKFFHLHESVDGISTSDALKLFHDDMSNSVEKQKDHAMPTLDKEKEHIPGSNDNLLKTYYEDMQSLILESPALNVHFEIPK